MITILILGIFTAFNFLILLYKLKAGRVLDFILDIGILIVLSSIFGGTFAGMTVAMVASFIVSLVLLFFRPSLFGKNNDGTGHHY